MLLAGLVNGHGECGHEAARVQSQKLGVLFVRIDFKVLMRNALFVEGDPGALDERAEPAAVEDERVGGRMSLCKDSGAAGGVWVEGGVDTAHFGGSMEEGLEVAGMGAAGFERIECNMSLGKQCRGT